MLPRKALSATVRLAKAIAVPPVIATWVYRMIKRDDERKDDLAFRPPGSKRGVWEPAFLAVGALLGEPPDRAVSALSARHGEAAATFVSALETALDSSSRDVRAIGMARALSDLAVAVDALRLA